MISGFFYFCSVSIITSADKDGWHPKYKVKLLFFSFNKEKKIKFVNIFFRALAGKTLFITGASRGIGKAIALKAAKDGANIVIAAKTAEPHPKLPGTIYTAAKEGKFSTIPTKERSSVFLIN